VATVLVAFLTVMSAIHPARLMEALGEKGVSFRVSYLFAASLNAVPRMRERASGILEAQRARGLAVGGGPLGRLRAVAPLVLPLVLGSLAEVEERALALETRAARSETGRTVLDPPRDSLSERVLRWGLAALLVVLVGWRILG
jgi:energy-coupling factor transport system permease protein